MPGRFLFVHGSLQCLLFERVVVVRNRWLIALAAVGIHVSIGSVYAWSVLTRPIMEAMGFSLSETTWTFSIAILFLGLSAGFLGSFVEKYGPKKSGLISMLVTFALTAEKELKKLRLCYQNHYRILSKIGNHRQFVYFF